MIWKQNNLFKNIYTIYLHNLIYPQGVRWLIGMLYVFIPNTTYSTAFL